MTETLVSSPLTRSRAFPPSYGTPRPGSVNVNPYRPPSTEMHFHGMYGEYTPFQPQGRGMAVPEVPASVYLSRELCQSVSFGKLAHDVLRQQLPSNQLAWLPIFKADLIKRQRAVTTLFIPAPDLPTPPLHNVRSARLSALPLRFVLPEAVILRIILYHFDNGGGGFGHGQHRDVAAVRRTARGTWDKVNFGGGGTQ